MPSLESTLTKSRVQPKSKRIKGSQIPRISHEPKIYGGYGQEAYELSAEYYLTLLEWQKNVLNIWLGFDVNNDWAAMRCGLMVPRQNGKTALVIVRIIFGLLVLGETIVYTAHQQKTATEIFRIIDRILEHPDLKKKVKGRPMRAIGREEYFLKNGGRIKFIARSNVSGLGFTIDTLICDEAQELTDSQIEALQPTLSAAPHDPQMILIGTAPKFTSPAEVFGRWRRAAINQTDKKLSWHEWSVSEIGDIFDPVRWAETNPSLGYQLRTTAIEGETVGMDREGFAIQRLCWWPDKTAERLISPGDWDALATETPPKEGKLAYGVRFAPDGSVVSVAVALKPTRGQVHVEVIHNRSLKDGVGWLIKWIMERRDKVAVVVIGGKAGAGALSEQLIAEGMPSKAIHLEKTQDVIISSSRMYAAVTDKTLTHFNQPVLNNAVYNAKKRPVGNDGGWGWAGIDGYDVTPLEAVSLAFWGVSETKRDPSRKLRIA